MTFHRLIAATIVVTLSLSAAAQRRAIAGTGGAIPQGTPIEIRMIDSLNSETAKSGDLFHATLEQAIVQNGQTLYPQGADVTGTVLRAHSSGRLSDPGELELQLTSISFGGRTYPIASEPYAIKGESHTKSNVTKIGGGAAAGAIIGAIAGGGKGAAIGTVVGAGAGTGVAAATGKKDSRIESEALLNFVAAAPVNGSWPAATPVQRSESAATRSYDDPRRTVAPEYSLRDRQYIRGCLANTSNLPPGLANRDNLPPGLEKQVERNGTLPPGLQKRVQPLPEACSSRLPKLPVDWSRVVLGSRVLLLDPSNRVADVFLIDDDN
ncbi:MAG: hypothetical protein ACR2IF_16145 [Terriglobales bacterium]